MPIRIKRHIKPFVWVLFLSMLVSSWANDSSPSKQSICFHEMISKCEEEIQRRFHLTPTGSGGKVHDRIEEFKFFFSTTQDLSIDKARILEVQVCESLLALINSCDPPTLLDHYPFSSKDITVYIRFHDRSEEFHNYQSVGDKLAVVCLINGYISYDRCHAREERYLTNQKESFEEAAKQVHGGVHKGGGR